MTMLKPHQRPRQRLPLAMVLWGLAIPLAGCGVDRTVTGSIVPEDYRERHPIVLAAAPTNLDIFPVSAGSGLNAASSARLREFAGRYAGRGQSQIQVLLPRGSGNDRLAHHALNGIRRELAAGGARGHLAVGSYQVLDPGLAAPVRLSFKELKARVASTCGQWPADLASGSSLESWNNRPYWNFGCATQNALAVQIDDPRDLAAPRAEQPADTTMRTRAITNVRKGVDPGTTWVTKNSSIGSVGGN